MEGGSRSQKALRAGIEKNSSSSQTYNKLWSNPLGSLFIPLRKQFYFYSLHMRYSKDFESPNSDLFMVQKSRTFLLLHEIIKVN